MPDSPDPVVPSASPDPVSRLSSSSSPPVAASGVPGLVLSPFRALRYDSAVAGDLATLTSPPYDVIDADGVAALEAQSQYNVVRLILPREPANSGPDTVDTPPDRYTAARGTLDAWRDSGVLQPDDAPGLYVYEQAQPGGHVQRGLIGALLLTPPEDEIVLPHENTMSGPVSDRLALYTAVEADLEPIFLVYDGGGAASQAVAEVDAASSSAALLLDVALPDGLQHRVWALTDPDQLAAIAADLLPRTALIADGHHRYATYLARQAARRAEGAGAGPWDVGLTFLVDGSAFGPEVHPIHRVIPGVPAAQLAARAETGMRVEALTGDLDEALERLASVAGAGFLLVDGDRQWLLSVPDPLAVGQALGDDHSADWAALDVSVLHGFVVPVLWGLPDSVEAVGYEHDVDAALAAAARTGGTAVLLNATPVQAVTAVAARGERMPRKSTLFTPKPRTGLLIRDYRDA